MSETNETNETNEKPDWFKVGPNNEVTVTLTKPHEINGAKIGYLVMREPLVSDHMVAVESRGTEFTKETVMFSNLCSIAPADLQRLPMQDYRRLQSAYSVCFFD
jgi:hypothetical protein